MTACFYDKRGGMVGIDNHLFLERGPGPLAVIGIPRPSSVHIVWAANWWASNDKYAATVTSDGNLMVQGDFQIQWVPHVPIDAAKGALLEIGMLAAIIANSESKPFLTKFNVHGNGAPLACCLAWFVGLNLNCEGYGALLNPNSVVTTPTLGDFAAAIAAFALNMAIDAILEEIIEAVVPDVPIGPREDEFRPVKEVVKTIFDKVVRPYTVDPLVEKYKPQLQEFVDAL
jgi:hypothetical protein